MLPVSVPEGVKLGDEPLAILACHPNVYLEEGTDVWECLDPVLNRVIGAQVGAARTVEILAALIRRGPFGRIQRSAAKIQQEGQGY